MAISLSFRAEKSSIVPLEPQCELHPRYTIPTKLLPQNKHRWTASSSSFTTQLRAAAGSQLSSTAELCDTGRSALRLQPMQVLTIEVDKMKEVTEQRAQEWPLGHVARVISSNGTSVWQAGHSSCKPAIDGSIAIAAFTLVDNASASRDRSAGDPASRDCTTTRSTNGTSDGPSAVTTAVKWRTKMRSTWCDILVS